ncbi:SPOR domain-containing protein [Methylibium sp.]|uniref:SPOR domain-containing protein n=1 Tax=Methylibium sp. TaxID=2067992 RepID=UPI003D11E38B
MGLLSFFHRKPETGSAAVPTDPDSVELARRRARRRLVGAAVLVVLGVVGFPLLFDTAPRPLSSDIPIDIPRKEAVPPLAAKPAANPPAAAAPAPKDDPVVTENAADAGREVAAPAVESKVAAAAPPDKPVEKRVEKSADRKPEPAAGKAATPLRPAESARARAALEGKPVAAAKPEVAGKAVDGATRFVVQVGAYGEADAARAARLRVEKLGFKAYTQVVETPSGKRIRVRIGPYSDRAEADKVASQIKQSGLNSAVLTL